LALVTVLGAASAVVLHQTSGELTPCRAVAARARTHLPAVSQDVLETCLGIKGEGGLTGMLVQLGMAVAGTSKEKVARRFQEKLDEELRAGLFTASETRCTIILLEGVVGRANGGPQQVAKEVGDSHKAVCTGDDKPAKDPKK
jgi:hypothetical protein